MGGLLSDFWLWLLAVVQHWQAYATGGVVMGLVGGYERYRNETISRRTYFSAMGAFFIAACFLAWRDEHTALQKAFRPNFKLDTYGTTYFRLVPYDPGSTGIIVHAGMRNTGTPSAVVEWRLYVLAAGVRARRAEVLDLREVMEANPETFVGRAYKEEDSLVQKTAEHPVPTGGMSRGWLAFKVPGVSRDLLSNPTTVLTLAAVDIAGMSHALTYPNKDRVGKIPRIPGTERQERSK